MLIFIVVVVNVKEIGLEIRNWFVCLRRNVDWLFRSFVCYVIILWNMDNVYGFIKRKVFIKIVLCYNLYL